MKLGFLYTLILTIILTLTLAACGGGGGAPKGSGDAGDKSKPAAPAENIDVTMHDIYYGDKPDNAQNPLVWNVTTGAKVTVKLNNQGALDHNWAIVKPGQDISTPYNPATDDSKLLFNPGLTKAGAKNSADFTAPAPGEYKVVCTVPGHYPLMQGKLVVK